MSSPFFEDLSWLLSAFQRVAWSINAERSFDDRIVEKLAEAATGVVDEARDVGLGPLLPLQALPGPRPIMEENKARFTPKTKTA